MTSAHGYIQKPVLQ